MRRGPAAGTRWTRTPRSGVSGPRWLQDARDKAAARFAALGFPTVREEEWRFTNVAPIASKEFRTAGPVAVNLDEIDSLPYGQSPYRLVLVNGRFSAELSRQA